MRGKICRKLFSGFIQDSSAALENFSPSASTDTACPIGCPSRLYHKPGCCSVFSAVLAIGFSNATRDWAIMAGPDFRNVEGQNRLKAWIASQLSSAKGQLTQFAQEDGIGDVGMNRVRSLRC